MKRLVHSALFLLLCLALCLVLGPAAFAAEGAVILPDSTTVIEAEAFAGDTGITSVTIPESVTMIGERAFYGCTNIKDVYYYGTVQQWDEISIQSGNGPLTRASLHCSANPDDFYIELTYSHAFNPREWNYHAALLFSQMVETMTEGHIKINCYGERQLPCFQASIEKAIKGENWIGLEEPSLFADWVGDCAVLVGPMLYRNEGEYNYVMDSALTDNVKAALAEKNIHILDTHYTFGFRSLMTNEMITSPDDLSKINADGNREKMKIRSHSSPLFYETINAMGAKAVKMDFIDCLGAISNNELDGFDGNITTLAQTGLPPAYEVVKKVAETKHLISTRWLFMSETVYQSIPHKWRDNLDEAAAICAAWEQEKIYASEETMINMLNNEAGVTWNSVNIDAFTRACDPVFEWIVQEYDADPLLHSKIVALVESYRAMQ